MKKMYRAYKAFDGDKNELSNMMVREEYINRHQIVEKALERLIKDLIISGKIEKFARLKITDEEHEVVEVEVPPSYDESGKVVDGSQKMYILKT